MPDGGGECVWGWGDLCEVKLCKFEGRAFYFEEKRSEHEKFDFASKSYWKQVTLAVLVKINHHFQLQYVYFGTWIVV